MEQIYQSTNYGGDAAGNYQKFFVPSIGRPVATDLIDIAKLKPGEHVLDIACGTGVLTRLAVNSVGSAGSVIGLDLNPGMLAVANSATPAELSIDWIEASAEAIPLEDSVFDVVLCQMGLQFMTNKLAALREMHRVLKPGGRVYLNVPGPKPPLFAIMAEEISRHFGQEGAMFIDLVFSMHEASELRDLFENSGFQDVRIDAKSKKLIVPPPQEFLWQYIHSTPLAPKAMSADEHLRDNLERDVCARWEEFVVEGKVQFDVDMTTVSAIR